MRHRYCRIAKRILKLATEIDKQTFSLITHKYEIWRHRWFYDGKSFYRELRIEDTRVVNIVLSNILGTDQLTIILIMQPLVLMSSESDMQTRQLQLWHFNVTIVMLSLNIFS